MLWHNGLADRDGTCRRPLPVLYRARTHRENVPLQLCNASRDCDGLCAIVGWLKHVKFFFFFQILPNSACNVQDFNPIAYHLGLAHVSASRYRCQALVLLFNIGGSTATVTTASVLLHVLLTYKNWVPVQLVTDKVPSHLKVNRPEN